MRVENAAIGRYQNELRSRRTRIYAEVGIPAICFDIFKGESMANVVKRLNHFYGEEIRYTPQAGLITLYGKLDVNEPLELALEALAATADLIVTKKDNFIEIAKRE